MTLVLIGDVHLRDKAFSSRTETYCQDILNKLYEVSKIAQDCGAEGIILAGDTFDIPSPIRNSHKLVMEFITWAKSAPCPVFATAGNHDLRYDRVQSLSEGQPLGVAFASGHVIELSGWNPEIGVYGIPWQDWDNNSSVYDSLAEYRKTAGEFMDPLIVTHAPFFPPGHEPPYEFFSTSVFAGMMQDYGSVFYGHIHDYHGVYTIGNVTFCNNGALSRGSLTEKEINREILATVWDGEFRSVVVPHRPASEVFFIEEVMERRQQVKKNAGFLESIGSTVLNSTSVEDILQEARDANIPQRVRDICEDLLREVSSD